MPNYFHSVRLEKEKCKGCTNCLRGCPTEAIRVRNGKAMIINDRCIDCGECIRVCPYHAKLAVTDALSVMNDFTYKIALPAPSLYAQFKGLPSEEHLINALYSLNIDGVYPVAKAADIVTNQTREYLKRGGVKTPVISTACPAICRLIQVRFPELLENLLPIETPMEIAARIAKKEFSEANGVPVEDIGAFFITPCPAKMTSIRHPISADKSAVDGAISFLDIYGVLSSQLKSIGDTPVNDQRVTASGYGVGWASSGGESFALQVDEYLAVDGIENVIRALEEIENNKFTDLLFFEGLACTSGCVGGPLTFENSYVGANRIRRMRKKIGSPAVFDDSVQQYLNDSLLNPDRPYEEAKVMALDDDLIVAMRKMQMIEALSKKLPGLDCGSCGSPSCHALAEDIVRGEAHELDCIFLLKEKVSSLAEELVLLSGSDGAHNTYR